METFHYHLNLLLLHMQGWKLALSMSNSKSDHWALFSKSVLDRTRLALACKAEWYQNVLQPSAEYLGSLLGVDQWAVCFNCLKVKTFFLDILDYLFTHSHYDSFQLNIFTEEIIRAGSAAALSTLLNRLDPILRQTAHLGRSACYSC
jgi:alpha-glucan,water dikinase